jgi:hypothetical protein
MIKIIPEDEELQLHLDGGLTIRFSPYSLKDSKKVELV